MGASQNYNVSLNIHANAQSAEKQLQNLQRQLQSIASMKVNVGASNMSQDLEKASQAAMKLSSYLAQATNTQTGNLDFSKFYQSIQKSGMHLQQYGAALQKMGPAGQKAFVGLADSIAKSEIPLTRTSKLVDGLWKGLKRTAGWQIQSSLIHGVIGGVQKAVGYAKDLNKSLADIRIVTGASADEMARFAQKANAAAKRLSTTTIDYTKASLIYYQQGLSDAEVKARTEATIKMANATGTSAQQVSNQMTAIWNNYDNGTKSLTHYADVMTALGAATASSTDEISQGLQKFASISNTVGLSYEYAASALATITAESRESADVVGNALKTLFSRIQGLKLGETLDDGTTLNKYSKALSAVGISIKDSSGDLKNMDDILNEMGNKWDTLARDEKMALAQTVAGVRQYTQLMTLMENWDSFKTNLNTAQTSAGTLDRQAAIYEESWQAASNRVRASWEGLWDNLISSDGFITVLDGLSGIVQFLDKMVTGLGGAGGAMLTFGGILTSVFNRQLSESLSNAAYGIKMLFPKQQQAMLAEREKMITDAQNALSEDSLGALGRENEYDARRTGMQDSLNASLLYAKNRDRMSSDQLLFEQMYSESVQQAQEERLAAGKAYDNARESRYDFFSKFYDKQMKENLLEKNINDVFNKDARIAEKNEAIRLKQQALNKVPRGKKFQSQRDAINQELGILQAEKTALLSNELSDKIAAQIFSRTENTAASESINALIEQRQNEISAFDKKYENRASEFAKPGEEGSDLYEDQKKYKAAQDSLKFLQSFSKGNIEVPKVSNFRDALSAQGAATAKLQQGFATAAQSGDAEALLTSLNEFSRTASNSMSGHKFITGLTELASKHDTSTDAGRKAFIEALGDEGEGYSGMMKKFAIQSMEEVSGAIYDAFQNDSDFFGRGMSREEFMAEARAAYGESEQARLAWEAKTKDYQDKVKAREENLRQTQKIQSGAEAVVSGAQGAMQALAAGESLKGLINSFSDGTATLTSSLTSLTSVALQSSMGFQGLNKALSSIKGLSAGAASGIALAATAILSLVSFVADAIDKAHTSRKEQQQNLVTSDNELQNAAQSTSQALDQYKKSNESYLDAVTKIKTLSSTPEELAENIFQASKQALQLISEYDLTNSQYTKNKNGLIEIDEKALEAVVNKQEDTTKAAEYANVLGQAINDRDYAELEATNATMEAEKEFYKIRAASLSEYNQISGTYGNSQMGAYARANLKSVASLTYGYMRSIWENGQWDQFIEANANLAMDWKAIRNSFERLDQKQQESDYYENTGLQNAIRITTNKMLADAGYNEQSQEFYSAYAEKVTSQITEDVKNGQFELLDTTVNKQLSGEEAAQVQELLSKYLGVEGAGQFKSENGNILYKGEGDTEYRHVTRSTINAWYAQEQILKKQNEYLTEATNDLAEVKKKYTIGTDDSAVEAGYFAEVFETTAGASAKSVNAFYKNASTADAESVWGQSWNLIDPNEQAQLAKIYGDNGLVSQLNLDGLLDNVNSADLMSLLKSSEELDSGSMENITGMFEELRELAKNADGTEDPKKIGDLVNALSTLDFSENANANLMKLSTTLKSLDFDVDTSKLSSMLDFLREIFGIGGIVENYEATGNTAIELVKLLNQVKPGQAISTETKNALLGNPYAGFVEDDFVQDASGNWHYKGSQEEYEAKRRDAYKLYADSQAGAAQSAADKDAFEKKTGLTYRDMNFEAFMATMSATTGEWKTKEVEGAPKTPPETPSTQQPQGWLNNPVMNPGATPNTPGASVPNSNLNPMSNVMNPQPVTTEYFEGKLTPQAQAFADYFGLTATVGADGSVTFSKDGSQLTGTQLEGLYNTYANMGLEGVAEQQSKDFLSSMMSAQEVMQGVNDGYFADENGIISEDALNQLSVFEHSSDRVAQAYYNLVDARNSYNAEDPDSVAITKQAQYNYDLQQSIDAVAAARGMDAEQIAIQAEAIGSNFTAVVTDADEATKDLQLSGKLTAEQVADMAAEMIAASNAANTLKSKSKDLYKDIKGKDAGKASAALKELESGVKALIGVEGDAARGGASFRKYLQENQDVVERAINGELKALTTLRQEYLNSSIEEGGFLNDVAAAAENVADGADLLANVTSNIGKLGESIQALSAEGLWNVGEGITAGMSTAGDAIHGVIGSLLQLGPAGQAAAATLGDIMGFDVQYITASVESLAEQDYQGVIGVVGEGGAVDFYPGNTAKEHADSSGNVLIPTIVPKGDGGGGGGSGGGGGGGPKKVANKRKSQTVKRYKQNDFKRANAQSAKKSASTKKDYLYGESKIAQMEKINKLAEKEAHITSDRIKESQKYLKEDRENLIKVMQKWGYDATFDEDGFLTSYEEAWTKIHEKIAKLYEDNELTADEQKLEEDYKVELEELEGALEDYENSLKELQADIEAYEESLYEMYDNKVEQMQHKVEFKIELNEDDLSYLDFWIEALGDSLYNALESLQTMGQKTNVLFGALDTYKQGVEDIYALSDDPLHTWATGGLDEVLTQDQVDALRENRDGLMDYMQQLLDLRETMQDKVLEVFDKWQEKLNSTMSTIEHYSSVLEHFKNIIDIVGKDSLGLNNQFMANLEQNAVNQSMDTIDVAKSHYDALVASNAEAQKNLEEAIASGDQARIEHWEEVVQSTSEAMQEAQDSLLSSLENTLTMIAEQFESAMTRAVEAFNDAIYAHGGLQGLQEDYSLIREQSALMAEDYQKIYELSKLNRNINKTLNDSNIIAGKQKMKNLQQEINELQASGVQLSQYDLEYLQAKYELRLAEIELENAQNNKDTVRLSKDSEGNWSYVYTSSVDKVDEAQQKYEDALYKMQNLSYEYMEEMSSTMMQTSLAMMEEIQALRIQDFDSYEAYAAEVQRIQDKYSAYLSIQQDELNKSVANNEILYNQDWQNYSNMTGYKISANQDWADNYYETTLGTLMGSESEVANFADTVFNLSNVLSGQLGMSAQEYFANMEIAMNKYGTSISGFGSNAASTITDISTKSKTAANDMKTMATDMTKSFKEISDAVVDWQEEFSEQINTMLEEIGTLVQNINEAIQKSAEMTGGKTDSGDLIGTEDAIKLLNEKEELGKFEAGENGQIIVNGETYANWIDYNAKFIEAIDAKLAEYSQAPLGSEARAQLAEELKDLFKRYHLFKDVVSRIYDPTSKSTLDLDNPNYSSFDTGGYTGEWGDSGKFAMLHEKELILNPDDTRNFLEALNVSKDMINSMIEMNAHASSLGLGSLSPGLLQDVAQNLEQQVSIVAEFPNAVDHNEIQEAFSNLINTASQYANRYNK